MPRAELWVGSSRGRDPVGRFEASLDKRGIGEEARERFYRKNFAELMAIEGGEHVSIFTHIDAIRTRVGGFLDAILTPPLSR